MKKCLSIFICFALAFGLFACAGEEGIEITTSVAESSETALSTTPAPATEASTVTEPSTEAAETSVTPETTTQSETTQAATLQSTAAPSTASPRQSETSSVSKAQTPVTTATEEASILSSSDGIDPKIEETAESEEETLSFTIECKAITENADKLDPAKKDFVPSDGIIFSGDVPVNENETVFDVLKRLCSENHCKADCQYCEKGIQIEYTFTPAFDTYYVEGIHQLYEFDCGSTSGWVYTVNGVSPEVGCSSYPAEAGDKIVFSYVI